MLGASTPPDAGLPGFSVDDAAAALQLEAPPAQLLPPNLLLAGGPIGPGPSLGPTLASVAANRLPDGWTGELVVVENGRARGAAEVLAALPPSALTRRCLLEPARGKSRALNRALAR